MKYLKIIFITILMCTSFIVSAAGEGGAFKVTSLRVNGNSILVAFDPAPAGCNGGSQYRMHAKVTNTVSGDPDPVPRPNYNVMVSMLLTAYTTGQTLKYIWYNVLPSGATSCSNNGDEILTLNSFEFTQK